MSVVIRLAVGGRKNAPKYRVTVADSRRFRNKKYLETVGFYDPNPSGKAVGIKLDLDRINYWVSKGAQVTDRVQHLLELNQAK